MKVGGRSRDDDEEVPVVLVEDGVPRVTTTEVELDRPRRPRRELLLVVLAVAVVAGVGLVGGGDGTEDPQDAATPATTARRGPRTESVEEYRATSTTTRPRRATSSTTSTMLVRLLSGSGPLLPGDPTRTTIGFTDSAGVATIVDLDTGDRCQVQVSTRDTWPWSGRESETFWVQAEERIVEVDHGCGVTERTTEFYGGWPSMITGDTIWVVDREGATVHEQLLRTSESTGRSFTVPRFSQVTMAAVDGGLVVSANGDMTLIGFRARELRSLGTGTVLAGRDRRVVFSACPALECEVGVLDVDTGDRRQLAATDAIPSDAPSISPDGRYVRVSTQRESSVMPTTLVLDLERGGTVLETELEQPVFTDDSQWLVGIERGDLAVVSIDGTYPQIPIDVSGHTVRTLAVLRSP